MHLTSTKPNTTILWRSFWSLAFLLATFYTWAQPNTIIISEINADDQVELTNTGTETLPIGNYWLCDFPTYTQLGDLTVVCGDLDRKSVV